MWNQTKEANLKSLTDELGQILDKCDNSTATDADYRRLEAVNKEARKLDVERANAKTAQSMASYASPDEWNGTMNPGAFNDGTPQRGQIPAWKLPEGQGSKLAQLKHHAPSPYDMAPEQLESLIVAGKSRQSFQTDVDLKGNRNKTLFGGLRDKAAVAEGASGSLISPIMLPNAFTMRTEPTRVAEFFTVQETEGQTVRWLQHTSNAVAYSALAVAEGAEKQDISPTLVKNQADYTVVAGLAKVTKQMFTDYEDVAAFIPRELSNWIIQGENYELLQGSGQLISGSTVDYHQKGLFNATGTLTRQFDSAGGDTPIDAILEAATDVREGGAYADVDMILLNPADWLAIRKIKTTFGSYVLDPNDPNTLGGIDNIFGYRVVVSTEVPQSKAAVLDSKLAVTIFRRWGLEIMANPYSDSAFEYNEIHYRAETRFALGVVYPEAICLVDLTDANAG